MSTPTNKTICDECEENIGFLKCSSCDQILCSSCDTKIHNKGKRKLHIRENLDKLQEELKNHSKTQNISENQDLIN